MLKIVLLLCCLTRGTFATLKVFHLKETKNDAELYCESISGALLSYGTEFINAARSCSVTDVLTNKPWSLDYGCFIVKEAEKETMITNNHLANCVSFCSDKAFDYIGVQVNKCYCYNHLVGGTPAGNCDAIDCPGNSKEKCGVNHMIVYRQVSTLPQFECQYVVFSADKYEMLNGDCSIPRNFICQVGDTSGIECIGSSITTDIPESSSNGADIETKSLVAESGPSLGVIIAIMLCIFLAIVVVLAIVFFKLRKKRRQKEDRLHIHMTNHDNNDEFINAFREQPGYHNVDLGIRDPVPIVAFGGDGVDLDREPAKEPVYTAVHKNNKDNRKTSNIDTHVPEPAYDEVYQPSNSNNNVEENHNFRHARRFQNGNVDGSYVGLRKPGDTNRTNSMTINTNQHVPNDLSQNKIFRNNQKRHGSLDDDLY
ncbi:uncharacterized protein LOC127730352 [Mytilus californianus]|uniref:uncharacterized protein LOC127730352 n=1 Tax=Mytilus californianus TaxID=6549 RepID=UPI002246F187|nr:uncharacterized protein LOC127730352 [Mytilus californianus]